MENIQKETFVSYTTVAKAAHELEEINVISVVRKEKQYHLREVIFTHY